MRRDGKLSGVLHILLHMAEADGPVTSERLAGVMGTNPVVVRRIMGGLRLLGLVASEKGHGGGWRIARDLHGVTLHDVYVALGAPEPFAIGHRNKAPRCLVEQAVNAALDTALSDAERLLMERMRGVTLGQLGADFRARLAGRGPCDEKDHTDAT